MNAETNSDMITLDGGNLPMLGETAGTAVAAQQKAIVQARYMVAFARPRDIDRVREGLMKDAKRPSFAAVAIYNKPIGKGVTGPSIRFAEAAIRHMTNITVETFTIYDDREKRIVRVCVTDLEANVPYSQDVTIEKSVERKNPKKGDVVLRKRTNSYGDEVSLIEATDDDILNKQNALISKAVRTLGLRLVPGDLIDEAMYQVRQTQKDADAKDPDSARLRLFDSFADVGVKIASLKEYLGHDGSVLSPKELSDLRGLYTAIRDGEATWAEAMDAKRPAKVANNASDLGARMEAARAAGAVPPTVAKGPERDPDTGEILPPELQSPATAPPTPPPSDS